ncbi:hypothetical protein V6N12_010337 [Hibiscus sabdariffa]|uniref:Uncharacterized protein n=1 Tax=Hibiscus sabdariffa TaxID=183260 RepID=A0ABR2EK52_9ROSI
MPSCDLRCGISGLIGGSGASNLANLLAVSAPIPPLSLSGHLGALAGDLGCFPLNDEAYPPSSHWPTSTPVILRLAFTTAPVGSLNQATAYESPAHSSTGTRSEPWAPPTAWELTISCSISLPDGERKLVMLSATGLSPSRVGHFTALPSSTTL